MRKHSNGKWNQGSRWDFSEPTIHVKGVGAGEEREMCGEGDTISLDDFSIKGQKKNVISLPYLSEAYTCPSFHANFFRLSSNYTSN